MADTPTAPRRQARRPGPRRRRLRLHRRARRRSSSGATRSWSWSPRPRAATPARRLDELYPRYRVPIELTELDLDSLEGVDAAIVAYPHGAAAPTVAALRGLGVAGRRPLRRLPPARPADLRALVRRARRAGAARGRRLRADRALPRRAARGRAGRDPGLLPDREPARPGAARRTRPGRGGLRRRDAGHLRLRAQQRRHRPLHLDDRERLPLQDRGPPPPARDRAGAGGARQPAPVTFVPHLLPLDQGELSTCFARLTEPVSKEEVQARTGSATRTSPSSSVARRPAGPARRPRDERVPRLRHGRGARPRARLLRDRQHLEGRLRPGRPEPEPDAGPRRDRGALSDGASSGRAGSTRPTGVEELDPAQLAPGFRAGAAHCGLKGGGKTDVGLLVCDAEEVASAVLLTRNASAAAPVRVCRDRVERGAVRAAVVNAGNANAETGEQGLADAWAMCGEAGAQLGVAPERGRRRRDRDDRRAAADRRRPRRDRRGRRGALGRRAGWRSPRRS